MPARGGSGAPSGRDSRDAVDIKPTSGNSNVQGGGGKGGGGLGRNYSVGFSGRGWGPGDTGRKKGVTREKHDAEKQLL